VTRIHSYNRVGWTEGKNIVVGIRLRCVLLRPSGFRKQVAATARQAGGTCWAPKSWSLKP